MIQFSPVYAPREFSAIIGLGSPSGRPGISFPGVPMQNRPALVIGFGRAGSIQTFKNRTVAFMSALLNHAGQPVTAP